jgi:hypothetical protein
MHRGQQVVKPGAGVPLKAGGVDEVAAADRVHRFPGHLGLGLGGIPAILNQLDDPVALTQSGNFGRTSGIDDPYELTGSGFLCVKIEAVPVEVIPQRFKNYRNICYLIFALAFGFVIWKVKKFFIK